MKKLTPIKSIRAFCLECAGSSNDVRDCTANEKDIAEMVPLEDRDTYPECPLYPYRLGRRPVYTATNAKTDKKIDSRAKKATFQSIRNDSTSGQRG